MAILDNKLNYIKVNKALTKFQDLSSKYYIGKSLTSLISKTPKEYQLKSIAKLKKILKNKKPLFETQQFIEKIDKNTIKESYWIASLFPIQVEKDTLIGISAIDITQLKKTEKLLKEHTQKLEILNKILAESQAKDKAILESMDEGVLVSDQKGEVIVTQRKAGEILGLKPQSMLGEKVYNLFPIVDENGKKMAWKKRPCLKVLKTGKSIHNIYWISRKDKKKIALSMHISAFKVNKKIIGTVNIFSDITKNLEIYRTKNEFIAIASHQLRTPLSISNWHHERLLNGELGPLNDSQLEYIRKTQHATQGMIELVNTFLDVSKIEMGTYILSPNFIDAVNISDNVLNEFQHLALEKNLHILNVYSKKSLIVNIDTNFLKMILQNLLSNAIKYTSKNGKIQLNLYCKIKKDSKQYFKIEVSDTGIGIPKDQASKVFQKFFRAENAKIADSEGSGLGLYAVQSLLKKIDGKIWFRSYKQKKNFKKTFHTCFHVEIPLSKITKNNF